MTERTHTETEASAMVAAALREAAYEAKRIPNLSPPSDYSEAILALIPTDDNTALDKLIAEAERRGMERAAKIAEDYEGPELDGRGYDAQLGDASATKHAVADAIRAEMGDHT